MDLLDLYWNFSSIFLRSYFLIDFLAVEGEEDTFDLFGDDIVEFNFFNLSGDVNVLFKSFCCSLFLFLARIYEQFGNTVVKLSPAPIRADVEFDVARSEFHNPKLQLI